VGVQHVWFDVQTPPSAHALGHTTVWPQLFVTVAPHAPAHAAALSGVQQVPSVLHSSAAPEHAPVPLAPHATTCPQLFVATPQFFPAHVFVAGSGLHPQLLAMQAVPPSHCPQST
jgi:hypothetical protein